MKKILLSLTLITIFLLTGCLSNNSENIVKNTNADKEQDLLGLIPERTTIKENILSNIKTGAELKSAPEIGNYYFSISDEQIITQDDNATVEIQFIYIDNYQNTSTTEVEITTEGNIQYYYFYNDDKWYYQGFDFNITEISKGIVQGTINYAQNPIQGVKLYAKSGDEYSFLSETDSNGDFILNSLLFNTYDIHIFGEGFKDCIITSIVVDTTEIINIGSFELTSSMILENAAIAGYIYFDEFKTRPVQGADVWLEQNQTQVTTTVNSLQDGYYIIDDITEGNYVLNASIDNNSYTTEVIIESSDLGSAKFEDIILFNSDPIIQSVTPDTSEILMLFGDTQEFSINAIDIDNNTLIYNWSSFNGSLDTNENVCIFTKDFDGTTEIKVTVKDNMGGIAYHQWRVTE